MRRLLSAFVGVALVWPAALGCPSLAAQEGGAAAAGEANGGVAAWLNRIDQDFSRDIVRRLAQPPAAPAGTQMAQKAETRPGAPGEVRRDAGADPARARESQIGEWAGKVQEWLARAASTYQGKVMRPLSSPGPDAPAQNEVAGLSAEASAKLKRDLMERKRYDGDEAEVQRAEAEKRATDARRLEMEEGLKRDLMERKKYDLGLIGQPKPGEGQPPATDVRKQELEEQLKRDLAERRRQEDEAEARKAAEQKRLAAEAEAKRKGDEQAAAAKAAEEKRKAEEQAATAKVVQQKRLAAEAEAKRKADEQAAAAKAAEEKRLAAETEAKRKADEQAAVAKSAQQKQVADAADAAKRAAEEKAAAPKPVDPAKRWIEAETMRRSAEQKAKDADRKKAADEAEAKRKADEAEAKRKAEESAAREAAAKRAAEEAEAKRKTNAARMAAEASKVGDEVLAREKTAAAVPGVRARKNQAVVEEGSTDKEPARAASASSGSKGKRAVRQARAERREGRCRNAGRKVKPPATYVVARGDTLWDISELHYRSGARYPIIYRANRSNIADPDLIYPCQRLFLPARRR